LLNSQQKMREKNLRRANFVINHHARLTHEARNHLLTTRGARRFVPQVSEMLLQSDENARTLTETILAEGVRLIHIGAGLFANVGQREVCNGPARMVTLLAVIAAVMQSNHSSGARCWR
jgi:hypothetical protein